MTAAMAKSSLYSFQCRIANSASLDNRRERYPFLLLKFEESVSRHWIGWMIGIVGVVVAAAGVHFSRRVQDRNERTRSSEKRRRRRRTEDSGNKNRSFLVKIVKHLLILLLKDDLQERAPFVDGANFEQVYRNERRAVLTIPPPRRALGSGFPDLPTSTIPHVAEMVVEVTMILHPIF